MFLSITVGLRWLLDRVAEPDLSMSVLIRENKVMRHLLIAIVCCLTASALLAAGPIGGKQYFELREYRLKSSADAAKVDKYLTGALLPALTRLGAGPVGVFREIEERPEPIRFVLIPFDSIGQVAGVAAKLAQDEEYQKTAADYLATPRKEAPLSRIRSELLVAMDCMPHVKVPELARRSQDRVFEMRTYESPTERYGNLKVEMFNSGEVPIFLDCGITPVFLGQAIVGDLMPNLTYLTVYSSLEAKAEAWKKFPKHPDWIKLKAVPKFKGSVSKSHKWILIPLSGSQL